MTVAWGVFCIAFGLYANQLGSLIVAVNRIGSIFYGTMLAIFLTGFYLPRVGARAMFWGALVAQAAVIACVWWGWWRRWPSNGQRRIAVRTWSSLSASALSYGLQTPPLLAPLSCT